MEKEDTNLAISDQAVLLADAENESNEIAKSIDAEDAFASVFQGEHDFVLVVCGERKG